ncbi:flagellar assembly protein FliH [Sulfurimonas sp. HSL-1716]|uniref:flagellar assembly protein FliH n=1 Tax=Hydrocurvibacter sulfurireducens TaxID=3131937 RepID=UPI0031F9C322
MDILITTDRLDNHTIDKYKFKVFSHGDKEVKELESSENSQEIFKQFDAKKQDNEEQKHTASEKKDELVESLLQKTDEMSSNFIKLQMKLEACEEECAQKLEAAKKEAYQNGMDDAKEQFDTKLDNDKIVAVNQFAESVKKLDESANEYINVLEGIKKELLEAALDIAREVVEVELTSSSSKVAVTLANELIKDLQSASKIKLKVNPNDHGAVSEKVGSLGNIEIISDRAVSPGGVIAISDAGNIDAQILNRYERVKQAALKED